MLNTMRRTFTTSLLLAGLTLFTGCAGLGADSGPPPGLNITRGTEGWLVGSISRAKPSPFTQYSVGYMLVGAEGAQKGGQLRFAATGIPGLDTREDFNTDKEQGQVFAIPLPPGEYKLTHAIAFAPYGISGGSVMYLSRIPEAKFQITSGKSTYIGNLQISPSGPRSGFGVPLSANVQKLSTLERDFSLLKAKGDTSVAAPVDQWLYTLDLTLKQSEK